MSVLQTIQESLVKQFPLLSSQVVHVQDEPFLHMWKYSTTGLTYLANFHLIIQFNPEIHQYELKILTFHGKEIDHRSIDIKSEACVNLELLQFVQTFHDQGDWICHGLAPYEYSTEFFNNEVISRSNTCLFRVSSEQDDVCSECVKLQEHNEIQDTSMKWDDDELEEEPINEDHHDQLEDYMLKQELVELDEPATLNPVNGATNNEAKPEVKKVDAESTFGKKKRGRPPKPRPEGWVPKIRSKIRGRPRKPRPEGEVKKEPKPKRSYALIRAKHRSLEDEMQRVEDKAQNFKGECLVCLNPFKSRVTLKEDFERHQLYFSTDGSMNCPLCQVSVEKLQITVHFRENHPPQTCCLVCHEVMTNDKKSLRKHIKTTHQVRPRCTVCGKSMYDPKQLEVHMHTNHNATSMSTFCHRCGKPFAHKILLDRHLQRSCGVEQWPCQLCAKIFDTKIKMTKHLMVHCKEKPYVCPLCTYSCYKTENMNLHSRKVHRLRGCKDDFFVNEESLKRQREFLSYYTDKSKPLEPDSKKQPSEGQSDLNSTN